MDNGVFFLYWLCLFLIGIVISFLGILGEVFIKCYFNNIFVFLWLRIILEIIKFFGDVINIFFCVFKGINCV